MNYQEFNQICRKVVLYEESPWSATAVNYGFITTNGKIIDQDSTRELHSDIARRLGFGGQNPMQKAINAGLIRFSIAANGNASFEYIPNENSNKHIVNFIQKTKEITGIVYIDLNDKNRIYQSREWPVDRAMRFIPTLS